MKLTIITTLLTISLITAAFAAEDAPTRATGPVSPVAVKTEPAVIVSPTPVVAPPLAASAAKSLSAPENKPLTLGPLVANAPVKLGYVEVQKIFQESKAGKNAVETLKKNRDKFQKLLQAKGKKLEATKKSLESQAKQMNPLEQEAKGKEFQAKVAEFQEAGQKAEKEIAKQAEETRHKLQEQISKKIKEYGEKNGFTLIAAEMLYFDGAHQLTDVTDEVIKELNK